MKKIIDWTAIETDYIHGYYETDEKGNKIHIYPTAEKLGKKHDCNVHRIQIRCAQEKWMLRREQYKEKVKNIKINKSERINLLMSESSKYDTQNLQKIDQVDKILNIYLQKYNVLIDPETSNYVNEEGEEVKIDLKEINIMMDILMKKHQLSRSIFGESSSTKPSEGRSDIRKDVVKKSVITDKNSKDKSKNLEKIVNIIKSNTDLKDKLKREKEELEKMLKGNSNE